MITVALQRFSAGVDILAEFVHLDEGVPQEEGVGTEKASMNVMSWRFGACHMLTMLVLYRGHHRF